MEPKPNDEVLNTVFEDVRNSYRLLYLYQRRVMDLVRFIGIRYDFDYREGNPKFSSLSKPKNGLHFFAWDYLPMYNFQFSFDSKKVEVDNKETTLELILLLVSDTGYFDKHSNRDFRTDIETFEEPEKSKTQLHILLKSPATSIEEYEKAQLKSATKTPDFFQSGNELLIGYKADLSLFSNEKYTKEQLAIFEEHCRNRGIQIK